jgi:hypothetical protein
MIHPDLGIIGFAPPLMVILWPIEKDQQDRSVGQAPNKII